MVILWTLTVKGQTINACSESHIYFAEFVIIYNTYLNLRDFLVKCLKKKILILDFILKLWGKLSTKTQGYMLKFKKHENEKKILHI